jgi:hypothetical protein
MIALALMVSAILAPGHLASLEISCRHGSVSLPTANRMLDGMTEPQKAAGVSDEQLRRLFKDQGGVWARYSARTARSDYLYRSGNLRQPTYKVLEEAIIVEPSGISRLYVHFVLHKHYAKPHIIWLPFDSTATEPVCLG